MKKRLLHGKCAAAVFVEYSVIPPHQIGQGKGLV